MFIPVANVPYTRADVHEDPGQVHGQQPHQSQEHQRHLQAADPPGRGPTVWRGEHGRVIWGRARGWGIDMDI